MRAIKRIAAVTGALHWLAIGQGCHCDDETCARLGRYGERFALHADTCCGLNDPALQDQCVLDLLGKMDAAENILEQLDAACRAQERTRIDSLLLELERLLSNVVVTNRDGRPTNGLPVLLESDSIDLAMTWTFVGTGVARQAIASVNGATGLAAAAGANAINSGLPLSIIEVNEPGSSAGMSVQRWTLNPDAALSVIVNGTARTLNLSGTLAFSELEFSLAAGPGRLPTSFDLKVRWGDDAIRLLLDDSCPWNRVTETHLHVALRPVATDDRLHAELALYPTVFAIIPFAHDGSGCAISSTGGMVPGTQVFPSYYAGLGAGASDDVTGLRNCGDGDGDGVSNLAERIQESYRTRLEQLCGSQNQ